MNFHHEPSESPIFEAIENGQTRSLLNKTEIYRTLAKKYPIFSKFLIHVSLMTLPPAPLQENPKPPQQPVQPPPVPLPLTPLSPFQETPPSLSAPPPPPPPPPPSSQENPNLELPLGEPYEPRNDQVIEEHECNIKRISSNLREVINNIGKLPAPLNQPEHFLEPFTKIKFGPLKSKSVLNSLQHCVISFNRYLEFFEMNDQFIDQITIDSAISELCLILEEFLALNIYFLARVGHI
ncbi:hypothetical protein DDB_G0272160 [Dictyostelium discoideum AX4]|uniref:Uncharacterized protein n=1 Tax=Dictyostelium discoideum TaxID=44689 RepID=Q75JU3_DICDI|nr:hypothetical protein DDB_G0272160 [Dictyostelium discoideum AX4]EAL71232.1 hypothetical protein DDB_G0272160 [Dictyostelium discoideum AX4]|eukprot:XP_645250.1 hypothetical protein DDB_G0272160 [Dictyostelium discoideum AX4]